VAREKELGLGRRRGRLIELRFEACPWPPFRLDLTVWALRRRAQNQIETWDGRSYRRVVLVDSAKLELTVSQVKRASTPRLEVILTGAEMPISAEAEVRSLLDRLLGLNTDLSDFYARAARDDVLAELVERYRGLRPPRFPTIFECLLNAVACQQLSIAAGMTLLSRLAASAGPAVGALHACPTPENVLALPASALRGFGFSARKADTILGLARAAASGELELDAFEMLNDAAVVQSLIRRPGIGPWSADYVLLRGLGRLHVFPRTDAGALNGLRSFLRAVGRDDNPGAALAGWRPHAGLVYFHLLLRGLEQQGATFDTPAPPSEQVQP
jgi:DNA-3-methyladenine glycosylase II